MRIYLIGRFDRRALFRRRAGELEALGHRIVSQWQEITDDASDEEFLLWAPDAEKHRASFEDLVDLRGADTALAFTDSPEVPHAGGARHFELGYAAALGLRLIIVGPRENLHHWMPGIEHYPTWERLLSHLSRREAAPV